MVWVVTLAESLVERVERVVVLVRLGTAIYRLENSI
tara:strand:+ start:448 stop:555 length:108 start_codon:yes stop_codon:yes gene_type:complete